MYDIRTEEDFEYARSRLEGTVIRTNVGVPFLCSVLREEEDGIFCIGETLDNTSRVKILLDDTLVDSPILGFTNTEDTSYFISRAPVRRCWRQGLTSRNLMITCAPRAGRETTPNHYFLDSYEPLNQAILHNYPSYDEAVDYVKREEAVGRAFSRIFSVGSNMSLLYKNIKIVGDCLKDKPALRDEFFWLEESLKEAVDGDEDDN